MSNVNEAGQCKLEFVALAGKGGGLETLRICQYRQTLITTPSSNSQSTLQTKVHQSAINPTYHSDSSVITPLLQPRYCSCNKISTAVQDACW